MNDHQRKVAKPIAAAAVEMELGAAEVVRFEWVGKFTWVITGTSIVFTGYGLLKLFFIRLE